MSEALQNSNTLDTPIQFIKGVGPKRAEVLHSLGITRIKDLLYYAVKDVVNPFYDCEVDTSEVPQILSYGIGGHYKPHIDGESVWVTPIEIYLLFFI